MRDRVLRWVVVVGAVMMVQPRLTGQTPEPVPQERSIWSLHVQQTVIGQWHGGFTSPYEGVNSLKVDDEIRYSVTSTVFLGAALWEGADVYFDPELSGGAGLSSTMGVAGFPNGEVYRVGSPSPVVGIARVFLRQHIRLGDDTATVQAEDGPNSVAGVLPARRITLTMGKFSIPDIFDANSYSHDARSQFMNWALMSNGAWDFPADTRGYTWGVAVEYVQPAWALRAAACMVPYDANGMRMDPAVGTANSVTAELELPVHVWAAPGTVRLGSFLTHARMGDYRQAVEDPAARTDITLTRVDGRAKYGFMVNYEQEFSAAAGLFFRAGWNDGRTETWAFTEIDRSISCGAAWTGVLVCRPEDVAGVAVAVNGLSAGHRAYLEHGGYGFIIGDGKLVYGPESILEASYRARLTAAVWLTGDYQFILNPGYNTDRGPVHVFAVRFHLEV